MSTTLKRNYRYLDKERPMKITIGKEGLNKTWQAEFPEETKCVHCGGDSRIGFVAHEGMDERLSHMDRPDIHNTDPLRADDLRAREFANPEITEAWINQNWDYGKKPYRVCMYHRSARCNKCANVFGIDTRKGLTRSQTCPSCAAGSNSLVDLGPHFHIQVRNETVFIGA